MTRCLTIKALSTLAFACLTSQIVAASTPNAGRDIDSLWQIVEAQQAQIDDLKNQLSQAQTTLTSAQSRAKITEERLDVTANYLEEVEQDRSTSATSIGGYGELHYNRVEADDSSRDSKDIDLHRYVMFFNHEFNDRIRFFSEFEIEHSLVKDTADGSNGGEVEIEQAYIEFDLNENHQAKTGLFLIPIGILNETHEPPTFYGVERNDVENIIIPATWWEAGAAVSGQYSNGLSWDFAVHSGLEIPTVGGSAFRVRSGRQKVSQASAEQLAYTGRIQYSGIPGLSLAGTLHYQQDPSQVGRDGLDEGLLAEVHGVWSSGPFTVKALWAQWNFDGNAVELADLDQQTGWYVEPSYRFAGIGGDWGVYSRYEDLDGARTRDQFDQWELGVNFWPTDKVVLKADFRNRSHDRAGDRGRDFEAIDLGVGYQF